MAALGVALISVAAYVAGAVGIAEFEAIDLIYGGMLVAFGGTGLVITRRVRGNVIGPMFLGIALAAGLAELSHAVAESGGGGVAGAYASASWVPLMLPGVTLLPLLYPDGKPLTRRWLWLARAGVAGILAAFLGTFLRPGPLEDFPAVENPLGTPAASAFEVIAWPLVFAAMVGGMISLVLRYRRAGSLERLQIRWLAMAGAAAALAFIVGLTLIVTIESGSETAVYLVMMLGVLSLPVAAAVAMARYRLYDIDVVVNRALVYSGLTITLAATYLATVLLLQLVLPERSDFAVAASTLAVAAAFGPARARIQSAVDRRFFRRRYDAAQTLLGFGGRLRDEVDLDAVSTELTEVAAETMQPAHVSLWLRGGTT